MKGSYLQLQTAIFTINDNQQLIPTTLQHKYKKTRMWADAQRDGRPAEYRWRPVLNAAVWLTPTALVPFNNAANIGECNIWTQREFCTW